MNYNRSIAVALIFALLGALVIWQVRKRVASPQKTVIQEEINSNNKPKMDPLQTETTSIRDTSLENQENEKSNTKSLFDSTVVTICCKKLNQTYKIFKGDWVFHQKEHGDYLGNCAPSTNMIDICHFDESNFIFEKKRVPKNTKEAHLAHGDILSNICPETKRPNFRIDSGVKAVWNQVMKNAHYIVTIKGYDSLKSSGYETIATIEQMDTVFDLSKKINSKSGSEVLKYEDFQLDWELFFNGVRLKKVTKYLTQNKGGKFNNIECPFHETN